MRAFVAYVTSGHLQEVKNKRKLPTVISKGGRIRLQEVVIYKRFQLKWFDWEILVFSKSGRSREVVAYESWSQEEVWLY